VLSVFSALLVLCCSVVSLAQNREKFVISAKAGGINAVTGEARVHGKGDSDWQQLTITDDLKAGDRVRTASDGRVEILLNPGSYLRIGGNSEMELSNNSLANLEVRLIKGTAIVEATGADGLELNINISTPHTKLVIVRQGLYRLNVIPGDATELIVRKGRVILSDATQTKVKGGNKVIFSSTNVTVAKLTKEEKKQQEEIDDWSKQRAETLAKANRKITNKMLTAAFFSYQDYGWRDPYFGRGFGLWFYNPIQGCYTFIPWYYGWRSPYGSSYTTGIYNPYVNGGGSSNGYGYPAGGGVNGNGGNGAGGSNGGGPRPITPTPPAGGGGGYGGGNAGGVRQSMPSRPIESDTGRPLPNKSLEVSRPNN
jgi:hypothetical protein